MSGVRRSVRLTGTALIVLMTLGFIEVAARVAKGLQEVILDIPSVARLVNARLDLDPYKVPSDRHGAHWVLKPGFGASAEQMMALKEAGGRAEGAAAIKASGATEALVINADGFKGPPIDPAHSRPRLLAIGDSVTFGFVGLDYVRLLEKDLGGGVECVNGGVEGYSSRNALFEVERFRTLKPQVTLIFIGWNDLFAEDGSQGTLWGHSAAVKLGGKMLRWGNALVTDSVARARMLRAKPKQAIADTAEVRRAADYRPTAYLARIEALGDALEKAGSRVVLVTLPGLYVTDEAPSPKALVLGHLPEFTDNPFVLAEMTARANDGLRALAGRKGWELADLDAWSRTALVPRDAYFIDSVHFHVAALPLVAARLAEIVRPMTEEPVWEIRTGR